jgi:hypothetical protein
LEVCVRRPPGVRRATFMGPPSANLHTSSHSITVHSAKARNMACVAVNCLGRYHLANAFVENRSLTRKEVRLVAGERLEPPTEVIFVLLAKPR